MFTTHPLGRRDPLATLLRLWTWQVWRRVVGAAAIAEIDGCRILCPPWSNLASAWIAVGFHEYSEMAFARDFVRGGDVVVDVGANIGVYTVMLARRGAQVWAFEPDARACEILAANAQLNGVRDHIRIEPVALSDRSGESGFTIDQDSSNHLIPVAGDADTTTVQVKRLDDYADELALGHGSDAISYVKVDAEGFDGSVLRGADAMLRHSRPALCVETWGGGRQIRAWLAMRGYGVYFYDPQSRRLARVPDNYDQQCNFIGVHRDRIEWVEERLSAR